MALCRTATPAGRTDERGVGEYLGEHHLGVLTYPYNTVYRIAMTHTPTPWRAMRESTGLALREIARRTEINPGRLSIIERGVPATEDEAAKLRDVLGRVLLEQSEGSVEDGSVPA